MYEDAEEMEEIHLAWILKYLPIQIQNRESLSEYAESNIWSYGINRNGDAVIYAGECSSVFDDFGGWFVSKTPWSDENELLWWAQMAGCWNCNEDEENEIGDADCESCKGSGFILYDCINEPVCSAVQGQLEDPSNLTPEQLIFLQNLQSRH